MTTKELLAELPASYAEHFANTVYNTEGHDYNGDDYSIEILENGKIEICHTGNTIEFDTTEEVIEYINY